jgi:hypothetical protein
MPDLVDRHAERNPHFFIEFGLCPPRKVIGQKVELALAAQASEHNRFRQRGITRLQTATLAAQQVGGKPASVDFLEDSKGNFPCGRNSAHSFAISIAFAQPTGSAARLRARFVNHRFRTTTVRECPASFFQRPLEQEVLAALARRLGEQVGQLRENHAHIRHQRGWEDRSSSDCDETGEQSVFN